MFKENIAVYSQWNDWEEDLQTYTYSGYLLINLFDLHRAVKGLT